MLASKDNVPRGIAFMLGATVLFALSSAIAKWQVAIYPVGEVMFFRSLSSLLVCAAIILPVTGLAVFATQRPRDHLARGLSQSISQTFTVLAFSLMPLAGAIAINFAAVVGIAVCALAQGTCWSRALDRAGHGICRRSDRCRSRCRLAHARCAVRARKRGDVRKRDGGSSRHDSDRIDRDPLDVADGHDCGHSRVSASVRVSLAGLH